MTFLSVYLIGLGVIIGLMILLWLLSLVLKNASIVDIFWGTGFVITAWIFFFIAPEGLFARKMLITFMVTIWGLRLSFHIFFRNKGKGEDFRYQKWRDENARKWWWKSFFQVFLLQGILMWIITAPVLAAQYYGGSSSLGILDFLGVAIWLIGFYFETMGDLQLVRFKSNPENRGKVLDTGVWRYSRHPNYFGDSAQWWGNYFVSLSAGGWWTIFSPILMTFLLVRVSGVALLEKTMNSKPGYREYIETTSAFIPWIPRKKKY